MNRALVAPASLPASYEQLGANTCTGSAELTHSNVTVCIPPRSKVLDENPARSCISASKNHSQHLSKVFRLETTPILCFLRVTGTFNRTLVSVRTWRPEPISHV